MTVSRKLISDKSAKTVFAVLVSVVVGGAHIAAMPSAGAETQSTGTSCIDSRVDQYGVDPQFVCKLLEVGAHIEFSDDGQTLTTNLTDEQLVKQFKFTDAQVEDFHAILAGTYEPPKPTSPVYAERARFYLDNWALQSGTFAVLGTAASMGPAALSAAFISVSSMLGPVGTAVSAAVGVLGAPFWADLAIKITGALAQGKGVALYTKWGFPPIRAEIE